MTLFLPSPARGAGIDILLVPARPLSPSHWMARWAQRSARCRIVELGLWDEPHRNTWVNKLNLAIARQERPVVVVTEDIAALALAWWVEYEAATSPGAVLGAFVVNPPDVDRPGRDPRIARFGAIPRGELPFPTFLVHHSLGDVYHRRAMLRLAQDWGARPLCDLVSGSWSSGWSLLLSALGERAGRIAPAPYAWLEDHAPHREEERAPWPLREAPVPPWGADLLSQNRLAHVVWC
ncbi:alpha/beta hydrolase [Novosphingobium sp. 1949]|uniref:Alpha/beta hydrolase n=1 Tax=Novosphingobium organovorum TaxID=2930092 RepID=A0ABT0BDK5_9SPHN|nr:alpha/beta hydrolase [Novosphingobium organovorum]MCJ2182985.1 alpha/beta hydrolase [Novosphingobium organovorum]